MKSLQEHITEAVTPKYLTLGQIRKLKPGTLLIATYIDLEENPQDTITEEQKFVEINDWRIVTESTNKIDLKYDEADRACMIHNAKNSDTEFKLEYHHGIMKFQLK